jgi:AraC family transcriptional regulator, L-rhamnose operon transcriptional activator RhaR
METRIEMMRGSDFFREDVNLFVNRVEETFQLEYHAHDFHEIAYVSEGRGYHHLNGEVWPVSKGDVFLVPIGISHVFRPSSAAVGQKLVVYNCVFTQSFLEEAGKMVPDTDVNHLFSKEGKVVRDLHLTMEPLMQRMYDEFSTRRAGWSGVLFALSVQLLVDLSRHSARPEGTSPRVEAADTIGEAIDYIRVHAAEPLTIRLMADRCGISERHFFRLFRQRTGQPFLDYLQNLRVRIGCILLTDSRHKIDIVAEMAGYRDTQSFYQVFKRIVGMTPGQYRRMAQTDPSSSG